jgi:hypothetical protein
MPVTRTIDHQKGAIFTTATGMLSRDEILGHIQAKADAGVFGYAELFDTRDVTLDLSIADLHTIATAVRQAMGSTSSGKIAVVTNNSFIYGLARTYKVISREDNPRFEVFSHIDDARSWILEEVNGGPAGSGR